MLRLTADDLAFLRAIARGPIACLRHTPDAVRTIEEVLWPTVIEQIMRFFETADMVDTAFDLSQDENADRVFAALSVVVDLELDRLATYAGDRREIARLIVLSQAVDTAERGRFEHLAIFGTIPSDDAARVIH